MSRESKIHCKCRYDNVITNCGRVKWTVITTGGWIFGRLKEKYKCKQCAKRENNDN